MKKNKLVDQLELAVKAAEGKGEPPTEAIRRVLAEPAFNTANTDQTLVIREISRLLGRSFGHYFIPQVLEDAVSLLLKQREVSIVCDPWPGIGCLLSSVLTQHPEAKAVAYSFQQAAHELGELLVHQTAWFNVPFSAGVIDRETRFDVICSSLPFGGSRLVKTIETIDGEQVEVKGTKGEILLIESASLLKPGGVGLYSVPPSFFSSAVSPRKYLADLGLFIEAAFFMPFGTFEPYTNVPAYLVLISRKPIERLFVGSLVYDSAGTLPAVANFIAEKEGEELENGRFTAAEEFTGIERIRMDEELKLVSEGKALAHKSIQQIAILGEGGEPRIAVGQSKKGFRFETTRNSIYVPKIGRGDVVTAVDELQIKPQNYIQVALNNSMADAAFIASYLNSEIGQRSREAIKQGAAIASISKSSLRLLPVLCPKLRTQRDILSVQNGILSEQNTLHGLQNELASMQDDLWRDPIDFSLVEERREEFSLKVTPEIRQEVSDSLDRWVESLPFPLASILREWQTERLDSWNSRCMFLLKFFEAAAQFHAVVFLSAFTSDANGFEVHRRKLLELLGDSLSFERASFGTWKNVNEHLGKQTRTLLASKAMTDQERCADLFADKTLALPRLLSDTRLLGIFSEANNYRNDWGYGHGGIPNDNEAESHHSMLVAKLEDFRECIEDLWKRVFLVMPGAGKPSSAGYETDFKVLTGSNTQFVSGRRMLSHPLFVDELYLLQSEATEGLKLMRFLRMGPTPKTDKNACYFYSKLQKSSEIKFVSYHRADSSGVSGVDEGLLESIKMLTRV